MNNWIVVVDDDPISTRQLNICQDVKPDLKGVVTCKDETFDTEVSSLCKQVDSFPAFCNIKTNTCIYGLRTKKEDFENLVHLELK